MTMAWDMEQLFRSIDAAAKRRGGTDGANVLATKQLAQRLQQIAATIKPVPPPQVLCDEDVLDLWWFNSRDERTLGFCSEPTQRTVMLWLDGGDGGDMTDPDDGAIGTRMVWVMGGAE